MLIISGMEEQVFNKTWLKTHMQLANTEQKMSILCWVFTEHIIFGFIIPLGNKKSHRNLEFGICFEIMRLGW